VAKTTLVDRDIDYGERVVRALDETPRKAGLRPKAAFWFYFPEDDIWRLVLALPAAKRQSSQTVYRKLIDVLNRRVHGDISVDDIGIVPPDAPPVTLLRQAIRTGPTDVVGIRFSHNVINGQLIEDAYISLGLTFIEAA
jgi:hypothetical protein